jgi:hypothetical protein
MNEIADQVGDAARQASRRGVKRPRRSQLQREHDRTKVAELLLQRGQSARRIAHEVGLSASTVRRDLRAVRAEWQAERAQNFDDWVSRQIAELTLTVRAAWHGWEQSQHPTKRQSMKSKGVTRKPEQQGARAQVRAEDVLEFEQVLKEQTNCGDVRFLEVIEKCLAARAKLLGLNQPLKIAPTDPSGEQPYLDARAELLARIERQIKNTQRELPAGALGGGAPAPEAFALAPGERQQPAIEAVRVDESTYDATGSSGKISVEVPDDFRFK